MKQTTKLKDSRIIVLVDAATKKLLKAKAKSLGVSVGALVRQAVQARVAQ